jgi:hypothetical protein
MKTGNNNSDFDFELPAEKFKKNNFRNNLAYAREHEDKTQEAFTKAELKTDRLTHKTGNVFIEFESRNKPSGIETTKSEFWLTELVDESEDAYAVIMIPTDRLRRMVENNNYPVKNGGDDYTSKGYLIPRGDLLDHKK